MIRHSSHPNEPIAASSFASMWRPSGPGVYYRAPESRRSISADQIAYQYSPGCDQRRRGVWREQQLSRCHACGISAL